jgi:trans-aconitate 2-methyltransferase
MSYDFDGRKYRDASAHQKEGGGKVISTLQLTGYERILDLGCGDGSLTLKLAELVPNGSVLGIDSSVSMIEAAKGFGKNNLSFLIRDIDEINYFNEFDLVFSNAALHWVKDHNKLLNNIYRSLKKNGLMRVMFAGDGNCSFLIKVLHEVMSLPKYSRFFEYFEWPWYMPTVEQYQKIVSSTSFLEPNVWGINADRFFPDKKDMIKWINQPCLVPFLKHVDPSYRKQFRDYVIKRMIEETLQPDRTCFETFRVINVLAKK